MKSFATLPFDVVSEILSFFNIEELIFVIGFTCTKWRTNVAFPIISKHVSENYNIDLHNFDDLFRTRDGRNVVRHILRRCVKYYANILSKYSKDDSGQTITHPPNLMEILSILKYYFSFFKCPYAQAKKPQTSHPSSKKGIFGNFLGSLFGKKHSNDTSNEPCFTTIINLNDPKDVKHVQLNTTEHPKANLDHLSKIALDGNAKVGKTAFLLCSMDGVVTNPLDPYLTTIGIDFRAKTFVIGDNIFSEKLQVWDKQSNLNWLPESYISNATFIFEMFSLTDRNTFDSLVETANNLDRFTKKEIILLGTGSDMHHLRCVTSQEASKFAFERLNGALYQDISLLETCEAKSIVWYACLLQYCLREK
ncbi:hypothetical protein C9374_008954 [Naegleria lovaniensis]|uniref:F-box domain-containing protein n=1 Tax=Naegleria lovaniensis TaxID=51637 RepID=A0AA88GI16_NAELO|nr:uncharacterized protein C9374_008954 [Naegleria lovaniensis]KAG2377869.1 hypothetical protein C9374_008954 [Naegleria lovaniensis]